MTLACPLINVSSHSRPVKTENDCLISDNVLSLPGLLHRCVILAALCYNKSLEAPVAGLYFLRLSYHGIVCIRLIILKL